MKTALRFSTFTGIDANTNLQEAISIAKEFPFVEFGVLFSESMAGQDNRFPSIESIDNISAELSAEGIALAMHVCGKTAQAFVRGASNSISGMPDEILSRFNRVQLNVNTKKLFGTSSEVDSEPSPLFLNNPLLTKKEFIVQFNDSNIGLLTAAADHGISPVSILVDSSGGRGVTPDKWVSRCQILDQIDSAGAMVGFSGGLSADNIQGQLPLIIEASQGSPFWVDSEGKLRVNDWFNLEQVRRFCVNLQAVL